VALVRLRLRVRLGLRLGLRLSFHSSSWGLSHQLPVMRTVLCTAVKSQHGI